MPRLALAQGLGAASIAGVVKDASGAVLPGVTVEAASPVLIEKVRTTTSDAEGRYQLAELRAGTYTVTFSLQGFTTYKREALQLAPNFAATINAELKVGEVAETIVVSGQSPLVDTRSVSKAQVISQETLAALPTAKSVGGMLAFVPGAVSPANGVDTGGSKGEQSVRISVFGARPGDQRQYTNGLLYTNLNGDGGGRLYFVNPVTVQENVIDLGAAGSALYQTSGAVVNTIPREGGNRFSGTGFGAYTNHNLQSSNLSDDLKAQGLTVVNGVRQIYDANGLFGGPLVKDKWWFVASGRRSGSTLRAASLFHDASLTDWVYTPDTSRPVDPVEYNRNYQFRTTFALGNKDKIGASTDIQRHYRDQAFGQLDQGIARVEANAAMCHNDSLTQFTWSRPQSNSLLFEGGASIGLNAFGTANFGTALDGSDYEECGQSEPFRVNIADAARGANYHGVGAIGIGISNIFVSRFATSIVNGGHNFKTGFYLVRGNVTGNTVNRADDVGALPISYTFTNGNPTSMTLFADRNSDAHMDHDLALYAQDAWTMKRLTLNLGLRLDWIRQSLGEVDHPANALFPAYTSPALDSTPNWKDLNPRIGAAYDLFGNGKTAIKGGINRYVAGASTGVASLYGPTANFSTTRNWTDNGNFFPDCDLKNPAQQDLRGSGGDFCGPYNTPSVGSYVPSTSVIDTNFTEGWQKRGYNWRTTASVEQQLSNNMAVAATYARAIYGNFTVTDNLNLSPSDFDPYCITLPVDPRIPRSGQQLCGLYDQRINVATSNLIGFADNYVDKYSINGLKQSHQTEHFNGFDLQFNSRYRGGTAGGGWSVGNTIQNTAISANGGTINNSINQCFVVDNPEQLTSQVTPCDVKNPYQHRFRFNGSYEIPWGGVQLAAVYQDLPGPLIVANRTYTSAEINAQATGALGRNLRLATRTIDILEPFSMYGDRVRQLDLRISKLFRLNSQRFQANLDIYNLTNASTATFIRNTYTAPGAVTTTPWLQPTQVMDGRFVKFSAQFDF
jgi:hypothetical protein